MGKLGVVLMARALLSKSLIHFSVDGQKSVKKQQLEPDMEQQTGPKLGKKYVKAVYCHPAYLTYMKSTP